MVKPSIIATLATKDAINDLRLLLFSLALFNGGSGSALPTVYLYCDDYIKQRIPSFGYPGRIVSRDDLTRYSGKTRKEMEATPGLEYPSEWFDFMAEKMNLMNWAFEAEPDATATSGILFCDADICFTAPLPEIPGSAIVALSPHMIRASDEAKFGRYNGGFLWMLDSSVVSIWRMACMTGSRFYEQSALEEVANSLKGMQREGGPAVYEFPITQNYGWWRLWQSEVDPLEMQHAWTMNRMKAPNSAGILVSGEPLGSVHTHFKGAGASDGATRAYNEWVIGWLTRLKGGHAPARRLLAEIQRSPLSLAP